MSELPPSFALLEPWLRLGAFLGFLLAFAGLEALLPRRSRAFRRSERWPANLGISVFNALLGRVVAPFAAVAAALYAAEHGIGALAYFALPFWAKMAITLLVLDAFIFGQHVAFHHVPWLWRLHRVHHADPDLDVTTGLRFHPIEIILSQFLKAGVVLVLGAPVAAVIIFEIVLNATTLFNHSNLRLGSMTDGLIRLVVVTPDMHRVHHSTERQEHNSNFGFNLSLWDRLFGTYRAQPQTEHTRMTIGLTAYPGQGALSLWWLLTNPFASKTKPVQRSA